MSTGAAICKLPPDTHHFPGQFQGINCLAQATGETTGGRRWNLQWSVGGLLKPNDRNPGLGRCA
jgi:hypothetical protein